MADPGGGTHAGGTREYRRGNWTVSETMVLIEAKKMEDQRRTRRSIGLMDQTDQRNKPAELRWKWIEDCCWRKGCLRSQNQCNDKWDNLMRDYKKVREYERRAESLSDTTFSYWKMEKSERKERSLPSIMSPQIFEALVEVVEKKSIGQSQSQSQMVQQSLGSVHQPTPLSVQQHQIPAPDAPVVLPVPPPPSEQDEAMEQALPFPPPPRPPHVQTMLPTVDSDKNECPEASPSKRRRTRGAYAEAATVTSSGTGAGDDNEVGAAISKSASVIAEALRACEERQDKRHKDVVNLLERRLKIEESNAEVNRQGITGLAHAINNLADSIFALTSSHKNNQNQQGGDAKNTN